MSQFLPTKRKQEMLTVGYIRSNANNMNVPVALSHLCLAFHNINIHMIFTGAKLKQLLEMENHTAIYSKIMKYKDINFHCSICPNGWHKCDEGNVMFYLEKKSICKDIKSITYTCSMYCPQTNTKYLKGVSP